MLLVQAVGVNKLHILGWVSHSVKLIDHSIDRLKAEAQGALTISYRCKPSYWFSFFFQVFHWITLIDVASLATDDLCDLWLAQMPTRENLQLKNSVRESAGNKITHPVSCSQQSSFMIKEGGGCPHAVPSFSLIWSSLKVSSQLIFSLSSSSLCPHSFQPHVLPWDLRKRRQSQIRARDGCRTDRKLFSVGCVALPPLRKTSPFQS